MTKTKILYVEDEPFLGRIVKESLETRGFEVRLVADGALVQSSFQEMQPDICVLDIMLPNKDGYEVGNTIRETGSVPIIFVSAKNQTEDLLKGFQSGGNDYLRKPFSMEELIVRIQNLLQLTQKTAPKTTDNITVGKYSFNPRRYELTFNDKTRKLSHREMLLLQVLIENKNAPVTRKDVLMKVWGDDSFFNSRNLDVYINKLRDYLKDDDGVKIITLKGVGYHFSVS